MKLNDRIPGLPEWPVILKAEAGYSVEGMHISYRGYLLTRWLMRLAAVGAFYLLGKHEFGRYSIYEWQWPASIMMLYLMGYVAIITIFPVYKLVCWLLFRRRTRVDFLQNHLLINRKRFELSSQLNVQFRGYRPALTPEECRREQPRQAYQLLQFRIVEMIYGLRVVPVASFDNEKWADQFAVALQYAYDQARGGQADDYEEFDESTTTEKHLPE